MKKVWSVLLVLQMLFLVAACVEVDPSNADKYDLTVSVYDYEGNKKVDMSYDYQYKEYDNLLEVLEIKLDLKYQMSEYGAFITGINNIEPLDNSYWFSLYVNDAMSNVGVMDVEIKDNLKIDFKLSSMKSAIDFTLDVLLYDFINKDLSNYISDSKIDYYVFAGYQKMTKFNASLSKVSTLVTTTGVESMFPEIDNLGQAFRAAIYYKALKIDTSSVMTYLDGQSVTPGAYAVYSYYPLAIAKYLIDQTVDTVHLDQLAAEVNIADADYAGMALQALSIDQVKYASRIAVLVDYLKTNVSAGGYLDYLASPSAASTAQGVLGLVSVGLNPSNIEGINVIEALMAFKKDGGFSNKLDGNVDMLFATPQVYSALMAYKVFNDTYLNPSTSLYF